MSTEFLYTDSSFGWLANEIHISQARRETPRPVREKIEIPVEAKAETFKAARLPADFSHEKAYLRARHLRALKFGELMGDLARVIVDAVSGIRQSLTRSGKTEDLEQEVDFDTGTRQESQRNLQRAFLEA